MPGGVRYKFIPLFVLGSRSVHAHSLRNYNALESQMLHTKFHGNQTTGSDEDLQRALTINGMAIILIM